MTRKKLMTAARLRRIRAGFSLVELMVALAIGLISTIGMVSLFSGTSRSNRLQEGLARLQENGRFAAMRIENDLRMASAQYCSNSTGNRMVAPVTPLWKDRAPYVFAAQLDLPDSGGMRSVDPVTGARSLADATAAYALSPRFFMQGYTCSTGTACTPALWNASMFPSAGLASGQRVPNSDILTIRYLSGSGWPMAATNNLCTTGAAITLAPQAGDDPVSFAGSGLALISDCAAPSIIPISSAAGNNLIVGSMLSTAGTIPPKCTGKSERDIRIFNFPADFVTVTYYLAFRTNDNPDARPNAGGQRLVPTLIRRLNGVEQELVRGVDRLDFRYGVRDNVGNMRFLTARQVDNRMGGTITCPPKPDGVAPDPDSLSPVPLSEPGCLWRSVRRIEAHLLVNSGDEIPSLDTISRSFQYMGTTYALTETDTLPSGLSVNSYPRREFIAHTTERNKNP